MAAKNKKLGRGLDAIFGEGIENVLNDIEVPKGVATSQTEISIKDIHTNPYQPRKTFKDDKIEELAASIKEHGVFQPILVRKSSVSGYELVAGERRLRASKLAKKKTIPAIVAEFDDRQMMEISLLENIQREDLSPIEEAEAYEKLIEKLDYTQEELSNRIGKSRVYVTNTLRLLKLPSEIRKMVNEEKLSPGHARCLIGLEENKAIELSEMAVKKNMTVRDLERLVSKKEKPQKEVKKDPYLENVRYIMEAKLNTLIEVTKNKITISYNGNDNLNDILEKLGCLEEH